MKRLVMYFFLVFNFSSCVFFYHVAPKNIKRNFTFLYENQNTGVDSLLNIHGYYDLNDSLQVYGRVEFQCRMFFEDGTCVAGFFDYNEKRFYGGELNIPKLFKEIVESDSIKFTRYFYEGFSWGTYKLCGDTIKVQSVSRPRLGDMDRSWGASEKWYKIIDRNTIVRIYFRHLDAMNGMDLSAFQNMDGHVNYPLKFIPTSVQPTSDGWIKREKWFWKDELKYKEYMEKL